MIELNGLRGVLGFVDDHRTGGDMVRSMEPWASLSRLG